MNTRLAITGLLSLWLIGGGSGCIVVGGSSWAVTAWTEKKSERIEFDASGIRAMDIRTHNGAVSFQGQEAGATAYVEVTKKAGGWGIADAQEAMAAIEAFGEPSGEGELRIGWRWREPRRASWNAQVSFAVFAPANLNFQAVTHNGAVAVKDGKGDVDVVTHNGAVIVRSDGGSLAAQTHNGRVEAEFSGKHITLTTHNGRVRADLAACGVIHGEIVTHNGAVDVTLGEHASVNLSAAAHHGRIRCDVPFRKSHVTKRAVTGTLGAGEGSLSVATHNGGIRIRGSG